MSDQLLLEQIFEPFRRKFPPAQSPAQAMLSLTTTEMIEMITEFCPDIEWPEGGLPRFLISQGYIFEPFEKNERVKYFWLIA